MLKQQLRDELKQAMLAKNADKTSVLRMLISAIGYYEIQKGGAGYEATDEDVMDVIGKEVKKRKESIAKADNEKDQKLYGGLRAVYNFRANPALSASYNNCVASEKDYQSKITADIESNSNKVDTVAEQKQMNENINFRKKNIDYIAHGMCIYRLNVGIDMLLQVPGVTPNTIERMAISSSFNGKELSDLNSKFTPVALAKISDLLNLNAEKFHKVKVPGIYKESIKELDNARPTTRAEQQQIESEKKGLSIMSTQIENATYFHIEGEIITPLIQGKIQGK